MGRKNLKFKELFSNIGADAPAALVVFLVALPLCLGIALGSGAPLFSGIIAGVVGGIVVGIFSGSSLSVSGPAAGLTAIVAAAILKLPAYEAFLLAVVIAGVIQFILGMVKAGVIGDYIPSSVIKGMLAAIGLILILKQLPHLVGFDADFEGDEGFFQSDGSNTFSEIAKALNFITPGAIIVAFVSVVILLLFEQKFFKENKFLKLVPSALLVVIAGILVNWLFILFKPEIALQPTHLVTIPIASSFREFGSFFTLPDPAYLNNKDVWIAGVTIAIVASLESLLSIEAADKLDPFKRVSPPNQELRAQGIGNIVSGMLGGLPVTAVIVRSSANINAGAKSKMSAILHGVLLLACVYFIPGLLNLIPLSALAAVLIFVGYKLVKPSLFIEFYKKGWEQFIPFVVTIIAILFTDLLIGILIGMVVGMFFVVKSTVTTSIQIVNDEEKYLVRLRKDVSFLNKPYLKEKLEDIPDGSSVLIDVSRVDFIDQDVIEVIDDFIHHAPLYNINVEIKKGANGKEKLFKTAEI
jgi:MFS superfamily sulfate permease-like transporter